MTDKTALIMIARLIPVHVVLLLAVSIHPVVCMTICALQRGIRCAPMPFRTLLAAAVVLLQLKLQLITVIVVQVNYSNGCFSNCPGFDIVDGWCFCYEQYSPRNQTQRQICSRKGHLKTDDPKKFFLLQIVRIFRSGYSTIVLDGVSKYT